MPMTGSGVNPSTTTHTFVPKTAKHHSTGLEVPSTMPMSASSSASNISLWSGADRSHASRKSSLSFSPSDKALPTTMTPPTMSTAATHHPVSDAAAMGATSALFPAAPSKSTAISTTGVSSTAPGQVSGATPANAIASEYRERESHNLPATTPMNSSNEVSEAAGTMASTAGLPPVAPGQTSGETMTNTGPSGQYGSQQQQHHHHLGFADKVKNIFRRRSSAADHGSGTACLYSTSSPSSPPSSSSIGIDRTKSVPSGAAAAGMTAATAAAVGAAATTMPQQRSSAMTPPTIIKTSPTMPLCTAQTTEPTMGMDTAMAAPLPPAAAAAPLDHSNRPVSGVDTPRSSSSAATMSSTAATYTPSINNDVGMSESSPSTPVMEHATTTTRVLPDDNSGAMMATATTNIPETDTTPAVSATTTATAPANANMSFLETKRAQAKLSMKERVGEAIVKAEGVKGKVDEKKRQQEIEKHGPGASATTMTTKEKLADAAATASAAAALTAAYVGSKASAAKEAYLEKQEAKQGKMAMSTATPTAAASTTPAAVGAACPEVQQYPRPQGQQMDETRGGGRQV
ncbi:hypothetical protein BGZ98_004867, partial [Dissophora globulifera]